MGAGPRPVRAVAAEVPSHVRADLGFSEEEAAHTRKSSPESALLPIGTTRTTSSTSKPSSSASSTRTSTRALHFAFTCSDYLVRWLSILVGPARDVAKASRTTRDGPRLEGASGGPSSRRCSRLRPVASEPREQKRNYDLRCWRSTARGSPTGASATARWGAFLRPWVFAAPVHTGSFRSAAAA